MSLLWPENQRVALRPDGAALAAVGRFKSRIVPRGAWGCEPLSGSASWRACLETLVARLPVARRRSRASVILSNHFCHFALIERPREISGDAEAVGYARNRMQSLYGDAAKEFEVTMSLADKNAWLVCAVPTVLLEEVREVFAAKRTAVVSIQPYFAAAWNRARAAVGRKDGWFVVHEPKRLVVGLVSRGKWLRLAARRTGETLDQVLDVLDRERELLPQHCGRCEVWLYGSTIADVPPLYRGYTTHVIDVPSIKRIPTEEKRFYAMAA